MRLTLGWALLAMGLGVFLVRLHHAGPYWLPEEGNLLAAVGALVCGGWLVADVAVGAAMRRILDVVAFIGAPIAFFFSSYAILAEVEEVVVLESMDSAGEAVILRLWIMDDGGAEWINMGRGKAERARLDGAEVTLWRDGVAACRQTRVVDQDDVRARTNRLGAEKYAVKRLAMAIGLFPEEAPPEIVSVRLDRCTSANDR